jgi:hypothetical protein
VKRSGWRSDQTTGLATFLLFPGVPLVSLRAAIVARDVERVDELAERTAAIFPRIEGAADGWANLAAWMRWQGRLDLAEIWARRAAVARDGFIGVSRRELADALDGLTRAAFGLLLGMPILGFVLGVRRGVQRAREGVERTGLWWIPRARLPDLAAILIALVVTFLVSDRLIGKVGLTERKAAIPTAMLSDGWGSPEVADWLQRRLPDSPARAALVDYARAERGATAEGGRSDREPPTVATLHEAFTPPRPLEDRLSFLLGDFAELFEGFPVEKMLAPSRAAFLMLLFFFVGGFAGAQVPRVPSILAACVPGSARLLAPVAGLLIGAFLAAGTVVLGLEIPFADVRDRTHVVAFGLDLLPTSSDVLTWYEAHRALGAWVILGAIVLAQVLALALGRRRAAR